MIFKVLVVLLFCLRIFKSILKTNLIELPRVIATVENTLPYTY